MIKGKYSANFTSHNLHEIKKENLERKKFLKYFKDVLDEALSYEKRCLEGKRWGGNPLLIIIDAALDSIGLNYFKIVVPRVKRFENDIIKKYKINSIQDFLRFSPNSVELRKIMNNERVWNVAINICRELIEIKKEKKLSNDFMALKEWAEEADYHQWHRNRIGKIKGVGLITFQYLRMQAGVDTTMPDRVIEKVMGNLFNMNAENHIEFIEKMEVFSRKIGFSQILICWAIWLKYSDK